MYLPYLQSSFHSSLFFILFFKKYCLHPVPFRVFQSNVGNGKDQEHIFFPDEVISLSAQLICSWSIASDYLGFGQFLGQRQKNAYTTEPYAGWWKRAAVSPQHQTESKSQVVLIWRLLCPYCSSPSTPRLFLQSSGTAHKTINILKIKLTPGCRVVLLSRTSMREAINFKSPPSAAKIGSELHF